MVDLQIMTLKNLHTQIMCALDALLNELRRDDGGVGSVVCTWLGPLACRDW